jgi:protein TonB
MKIMELKKTSKTDLQNKKTMFFEVGLSLSLLIVLVAFNWSSSERPVSMFIADYNGIVYEEESIPVTQAEAPLPELPKVLQIPDIIEIVDGEVDVEFDFSDLKKDNSPQNWEYINALPPTVKSGEDKDVDEIISCVTMIIPFVIVEEKPMFQGKDADEFVKWIYSILSYPIEAQEKNIQGVVSISFTVNVDGFLSDIRSLQKIDPILEDYVIDLVNKSPRWIPGRQQNKPVRVMYQMSVVFKLQ